MTVRFASFNVENLFARPRAFNQTTWAQGQPILNAYAEFNALIEQPAYSPADKARMIQLLVQLDVYRVTNGIVRRYRTPTPKWAWLRANRGSFDVEHTDTGIEIVATGRGDIERRGLWGTPTNVNPPAQWDIYPQITSAHQAASDHAAIYIDINI